MATTQPKKVKMKPEELEKTAERLYGQSAKKIQDQRKKYDEEIDFKWNHNVPKAVSSERTEAEEKSLERLYKAPMEKKKMNLEKAEKKFEASGSQQKKMDPEELAALGDRLCNQSMRQKQDGIDKATKRVYGTAAEPKKLDKAQLEARVESLYTTAREKKKTADEQLGGKYLWKVDKKTISKADEKALADRLSTKAS